MLVVKILPAKSNSFNGVAYNEKKIDEEKSNLLSVKNFEGLDEKANKNDYIMYLQKHSSSNTRIKKPQFHASISAKGKETSFDDLVKFGEHYMSKMGYIDNPYLIYKHTDTDNNHIHIVSSRVDNDGKKISASLERVRTQKVINEFFGIDIQKKLEKKLKSIDKYSFNNMAQYKLLLEKNFNKVIEKKEHISIYISDKKIDLKKSDINTKIVRNTSKKKTLKSEKRKQEIKSTLLELSKKHNINEIVLLASKKQIDIRLFKAKDSDVNFGYSIIDNQAKKVYKGSEILPLKVLENNKKIIEEKVSFLELLNSMKNEKSTLQEVNNELNRVRKNVSKEGVVFDISNNDAKELFRLKRSDVYSLNYNTSVENINNKYKPQNENDIQILSFLFKVKKEDLKISNTDNLQRSEMANFYNYSLDFYIKNQLDTKEQLKDNNISLFKYKGEFFIIDESKNFIGSIELNEDLKKSIESEKLYIELKDYTSFDKEPTVYNDTSSLLSQLAYHFEYSEDNKDKKRKKKSSKNRSY